MRYPTDTSRGRAHHEALQAVWFDAVLRAGRDRGVPIGVWMLTDLAPSAIPGRAESAAPQEYTFGLRRLDGTLRPAAGVVRAWWRGTPPAGLTDTFSRSSSDGLPPGWRVDRPKAATYARDGGRRCRGSGQCADLGAPRATRSPSRTSSGSSRSTSAPGAGSGRRRRSGCPAPVP